MDEISLQVATFSHVQNYFSSLTKFKIASHNTDLPDNTQTEADLCHSFLTGWGPEHWRLCHCQPRSFSELWNLNTDNGTCWLSSRRAGESGPQPTLGYANPSAVWSWNLISINWNVSLSLAFLFSLFSPFRLCSAFWWLCQSHERACSTVGYDHKLWFTVGLSFSSLNNSNKLFNESLGNTRFCSCSDMCLH